MRRRDRPPRWSAPAGRARARSSASSWRSTARSEGRILVDGRDLATVPLGDYRGAPRRGAAGQLPLRRDDRREHPLLAARRDARRGRGGRGPRGALRRVRRSRSPTATTTVVGRARRAAVRRPAAARRHRAGDPRRPARSSSWTRRPRASTARARRSSRTACAACAQGRTTFVIAHRLSTIRSADQILVLDGGRDRRARHARRTAGAWTAATGSSTTSSTGGNGSGSSIPGEEWEGGDGDTARAAPRSEATAARRLLRSALSGLRAPASLAGRRVGSRRSGSSSCGRLALVLVGRQAAGDVVERRTSPASSTAPRDRPRRRCVRPRAPGSGRLRPLVAARSPRAWPCPRLGASGPKLRCRALHPDRPADRTATGTAHRPRRAGPCRGGPPPGRRRTARAGSRGRAPRSPTAVAP